MEKHTPHCRLSVVKSLISSGRFELTYSVRLGAMELGLKKSDVVDVILALTLADFHKSMTTHGNHRVWQDVYRPRTHVGDVYLKLTVADDVLVVSFKER